MFLAKYFYIIRSYSPQGSISKKGIIEHGENITLEEALQEITKKAGVDLNPFQSNVVLLVNDKRVDWNEEMSMQLKGGARLMWLTPPFGG
ncbi:MAG: hypothetical protein AB1420_03655 [Bacillota bacterium]